MSPEEARRFQARWQEIQSGFVGDPRGALERADALLGDAVDRFQSRLNEERRSLQSRWQPGDTPTESLRTSLQMYRELLDGVLP
jgi:hypothetical protein